MRRGAEMPSQTLSSKDETRATVQRKIDVFPAEMFASDSFWEQMDCWARLLSRWTDLRLLRKPIQNMARKYRNNRATFQRRLERLISLHYRKLGVPLKRSPEHTENTTTFPDGLSVRQLKAVDDSLVLFLSLLNGVPPSDSDGATIKRVFNALTARRAGRKRTKKAEYYVKALELLQSGKYSINPYHRISLELNPAYKDMAAPDRWMERDRLRKGIAREAQKQKAEFRRSRTGGPR